MPWPLPQDYNEAIQSPAANFADADLKRGEAVTNAIGLPIPCSGNFADVYQVRCPDGLRWAVKCFTREVPGLRERYQLISAHLKQAKLPFTVDFSYLDQGIRVAGKWYPILKMQWVEGQTLNQFVSKHLDKPAKLETLAQIWTRMGQYLRAAEVGHCDLQHGNILLVPGAHSLALKLIDYDGMWVPALATTKTGEVGHANYQHPRRLREATFSLEVDRFPLLLVATSLRALKAGGAALWLKYDNGDNMLFKKSDLLKPVKSPLFYELTRSNDSVVRPMADWLIESLRGKLETTPLLEEVMPSAAPLATAGSRPSRWATTAALPAAPPVATFLPIAPVVAAGGWDFVDSVLEKTPPKGRRSAPSTVHANGRRIGAVSAALLVLGLLSAFAVWTMSGPKPKSPSGAPAARVKPTPPKPIKDEADLVLDIDPPGAEASVDGVKQEAKTTGDVKPVTIRAKPGPHTITINKDGFKTRTADVELVLGRPVSLMMRLTPLDAPEPISTRFPILTGGTGTVRVEDDTLVLDDLDHIPACANIYFGDTKWADYDFQVDAKRLAGNTHCALWFRHEDPGNQLCYSFGKGSHLVTLENLVDARWRRGIQQEVGPIGNDDWYTLLVSVRDAEVRCFVDGRQTFMETRQDHLRGCVGFHANGSRFAFRNIKVTAPDGKVLLEGLPDLPMIK
jgi:PEGA domain